MLIIFEGLDNTGKSTQIELLRNYFAQKGKPFIITKSSNYKNVSSEEHKQLCIKEYKTIFNLGKTVDIIADRLHGGEYVYGPIYRGYSGDYIFEIEKNNLESVLIVLIDEPENLIKRDDGLSFSTNIEKKKEEIKKFTDFYEKSNINYKLLLNIKKLTINEVHKNIIDFLKYI